MKIDRVISMVMLLLQRDIISATELAETFEVSTRTIYRDVEAINQAGIPIVSHPGVYGGVGIMKGYKVDKRLFTASDIVSLMVGLGSVRSALNADSLNNTLARVKAMIPQEQLTKIDSEANQLHIDLTSWSQDSRTETQLLLAQEAIAGHHVLRFAYTDASGEVSIRNIEPYRLIYKNGWYLQGYCLTRNALRTFRLLCIAQMELTDQRFEPRAIDGDELEKNLSIDQPRVRVTIRFPESAKQSVVGHWGDAALMSYEDGHYTAEIAIPDDPHGYLLLLLVHGECECLAPKHVRDFVMKRAQTIAKTYGLL